MSSKEQQRLNRIVWFEIPATDLNRAVTFYEKLFDVSLKRTTMDSAELAVFPYPEGSIGGCVLAAPGLAPSTNGTIPYLNADPGLDSVLGRVEAAGGKVALPRTALPGEMGVYAHIIDTEGNRVGLHAMS
jgi:predicted enzyme related to lactoylglutathione lyase